MKRNYYPNYKNWMEHPNSESSKQRNEQRMKNPTTKICCADCGSSNGTLHKIKRNGVKAYVCDYCFQSMKDDD